MSESIIEVDSLGKRYRLGSMGLGSFRRSVAESWNRLRGNPIENSADDFWALQDASFSVAPGEVVGIVGHNGAGKSTLLKLLSRITEPTRGEIRLRGRLSSLLEVGTGFHPDLTGRENIYLNGSILGMKRHEIDRKLDEIVDFSGIESFIDTPVKRYSSGMTVRLGFSVAAHLDPEILIVDEVLAVGDASFQQKCLSRLDGVSKSGRTVLFVSHNLAAIRGLCQRCLLLDQGQIVSDGPTPVVIEDYLAQQASRTQENAFELCEESLGESHTQGVIRSIRLTSSTMNAGDTLEILVETEFPHAAPDFDLGIGINDNEQRRVCTLHTDCDPSFHAESHANRQTLRCRVPDISLFPGTYYLDAALAIRGQTVHRLDQCLRFSVGPGDFYGNAGRQFNGQFLIRHQWSQAA